MEKGTAKRVAAFVAIIFAVCIMFRPDTVHAEPQRADSGWTRATSEALVIKDMADYGGDFTVPEPEEETSFNPEVAGVIAVALIMCGVVIIVVNGRSKRK